MKRIMILAALLASLGAFALPQEAQAAFPGENGDIAFTNSNACAPATISRIHPDGTGLTNLTCNPVLPAFAQYPTFSADGKKIAFQLDPDDDTPFSRDLWVMDEDGSNRINVTNTDKLDEWQPQWFPSSAGKKIAYEGWRYSVTPENTLEFHGGVRVGTLGEDGKVAKTMLLASYGKNPAVSPDGDTIAFSRARGGQDAEIYLIRPNKPEGPKNQPIQLTDNASYHDDSPDFSPDGKRIVYTSARGEGVRDIVTMKVNGSDKKNVTKNKAIVGDAYPAYSPDGRYIAFSRGNDLWRMKTDGSEKTRILAADVHAYQPDWQPLR